MKKINSLKKQKGLSTVEYAILIAAVVGVVAIVVATIGPTIEGKVTSEISKV